MRSGDDWTEHTGSEAESALGYTFKDKSLLKTCFTHTSYSNVFGCEHNERLEFLGDAVIELLVSEHLFREQGGDEGALTELRQKFVSRPALVLAEQKLALMRFLRYSGGESNVGGKTPSNLYEAAVGGIYLDGGIEAARAFVGRTLSMSEHKNYKSLLQEYVQEKIRSTPVYRVREENGGFRCVVEALGQSAEGFGKNTKGAETAAAKSLYEKLQRGNQ